MFSDGKTYFLYYLHSLVLSLGPYAHSHVRKEHTKRISISEARAQGSPREGIMSHRQQQLTILKTNEKAEGSFYDPEIDVSM